MAARRKAPPSHEALGRAITALRHEKRMTQAALAERADLHVTYLSGVETGARNPTWTVLTKISQALGLSISELAARAERE